MRDAAIDAARAADREANARGRSSTAADKAARALERQAKADLRREVSLDGFIGALEQEARLAGELAEQKELTVALQKAQAVLTDSEGKALRDITDLERARIEAAIELKRETVERLEAERQSAEYARDQLVSAEELTRLRQSLFPEERAEAQRQSDLDRLRQARDQGRFGTGAAAEAEYDRAVAAVEKKFKEAGKAGARAFRDEGLLAAEAIGQVIGGAAGDALGGIVGILEGARSGDFTALGSKGGGIATLASQLFGGGSEFEKGFKSLFKDFLGEGGLDGTLKGLETSLTKGLNSIGVDGSLGAIGGRAAGGAAIGGVTDDILGLLGIKSSKTGASIGGAIGGAAFGPLGALGGSLLGGIGGGLFKGNSTANAVLTGAGDPRIGGKDRGGYETAGEIGGAVQSALQTIAQRLGGTLQAGGQTAIGTRGDEFRVNTSGTSLKLKNGARGFGQDADGAIAFALADRLADGAVAGLSDAVRRALRSSSDIDAALAEALQVKEIEDFVKGAASGFAAEANALEAQAAERLRIARQYGFELAKIEERNAEERAALLDQALRSSVGGLVDLLDELKFGDKAAGSAVDQRNALLAETATLEGRSNLSSAESARLAQLYDRLFDVSQEAFGTAGGFAGDRSRIEDTARRIVSETEARLQGELDAARASNGTDKRLDEANAHLDEVNERLSEILSAIRSGAGFFGGGSGGTLSSGLTYPVQP